MINETLSNATVTEVMADFVSGFIEAAECLVSDTDPTTGELVEDARGYEWDVQSKAEITLRALGYFLNQRPLFVAIACSDYDWRQIGIDTWLTLTGSGGGFHERSHIPDHVMERLDNALDLIHNDSDGPWINEQGLLDIG